MRLRHDGRRVGLEGALGGAALGLVLLVLLPQRAAAEGRPGRERPGAGFDLDPPAGASAEGSARLQPRRLERPQPPLGSAAVALTPLQLLGGALPSRPEGPGFTAVAELPWGESAPPRGVDLLSAAGWAAPLGPAGSAAASAPEARVSAPPLAPVLLVQLRSHDHLLASSVAGLASVRYQGEQVAIDASRLDLSRSPSPLVLISSEHGLTTAARSVLGEAVLALNHEHHGLQASWLTLPAIDGTTTLLTAQRLDLVPLQQTRLALQLDLAGVIASRLLDPGGDDRLLLQARTDLLLPPGAPAEAWAIELRNRALVDSTLELAAGDNSLEIVSQLALPAQLKPKLQPEWQLEVVALDNSLLLLGSGDDAVQLLTTTPRGDGLALRGSRLDLGAGDDTLVLQGAVQRSTIALGEGRNRALFSGPLHDATLVLSSGSANRVDLGDQSDALHLAIAPAATDPPLPLQLELRAGGGDDQLWLPALPSAASVTLWGGEGRDRLLLPAAAPGAGSLVLADLQGVATPLGWQLSDELAFASDGSPLIPSGLEGLGQPRLLPIAPLEQLLAGISAMAPQARAAQLAIATAPLGSELLWLEAEAGTVHRVASLPALTEAAG